MSNKLIYDSIVIGSSPASMVEAICLVYRGKRVLVVEQNDRIGGAWSTIDLPEGNNFEANCHILLGSREAYSVMKTFLGWSMQYLRPQPKIWIKGHCFHYNSPLRFLIRFFQNLIKKIRKVGYYGDKSLKINVSGRSLNFSPKKLLENSIDEMLHGHIFYPKEGTPEMMKKLSRKFNEQGGHIKFDERVRVLNVNKNDSSVFVQTDKQKYYSNEIIITNGSDLDEVIINGQKEKIESRNQNSIQFYMFLNDDTASTLSYVLLFGHPILHRISEMNKFHLSKNQFKSNERLLVIQLRNSFVESKESSLLGPQVLNALSVAGFVSSNAKINSCHLVNYPANYKNEGILDKISSNSKGRIRILPVDDLSKTILQRYRENFFRL